MRCRQWGRGCRFLTIFCSGMYVSLGLCSNMLTCWASLLLKCLLIQYHVDYCSIIFNISWFYSSESFVFSLFLCIFAIFYLFASPFIMLCFICLYMFSSLCLYIVSDDGNKDDQSIIQSCFFQISLSLLRSTVSNLRLQLDSNRKWRVMSTIFGPKVFRSAGLSMASNCLPEQKNLSTMQTILPHLALLFCITSTEAMS